MKKHTIDELKSIYIWFRGDDVGLTYFIEVYEELFQNSEKTDTFCPDYADDVLDDCIVSYLKFFLKHINIGHSMVYADKRAKDFIDEDENMCVYEAFLKVFEIDPLLAKNELILYCRTKGWTDPIQVNFFIHMMGQGEYDNLSEKSQKYYKSYLSKIRKGKSELFAQVYADYSLTDDFGDCYSEAYAWAFEKAVNAKKSKEIINEYCRSFAYEISDQSNKFEEAFKDKDFNFYHNKVIARIQAIEYLKKNEDIEDRKRFIYLYENTFINTVSINRYYHDISEEININVLKETLERFFKKK
jgi:hypothetical protein